MASASIMTEVMANKPVSEAQALLREVLEGLSTPGAAGGYAASEERLALAETVQRFPARLGCASLPWETLGRALTRG
jgi:nitrogen fixation NifU-like protein